MLIPTSIVYDQLYEVGAMAAEEHGAQKTAESLSWLVGYARAQGRGFGKVRIRFGEPLPLSEALADAGRASMRSSGSRSRSATGSTRRRRSPRPRWSRSRCSGSEDQALTLGEVRSDAGAVTRATSVPRGLPMTGELDLSADAGVRQALDALGRHGVVSRYDRGIEPVWSISPERHLEAAFYRNSSSISSSTVRSPSSCSSTSTSSRRKRRSSDGWEEALRIRDVLKFEFFFARKRDFERELRD